MRIKRIEVNEKYNGYEYLVYANSRGYRCGYVKIPKKHYLYGKNYFNELNVKFNRTLNPFIDSEGNVTMSSLFDVHGGITFAGKGTSAEFNKRGWWIGFDCAHYEDKPYFELMDEEYKRNYSYEYYQSSHGEIRSKEYVEQECKNLIDQIIKYFG